MKSQKLKNNKGITLVALVLTIIILIILAYIVINILYNNNIIEKAKEGKLDYNKKQAEEQIGLIINEWKLENVYDLSNLKEFLDGKEKMKIIDNYINIGNNEYIIIKGNLTFKLEQDLTFSVLSQKDSGITDNDIQWLLFDDGMLLITGSGSMNSNPWLNNHKDDIKSLIIAEGITSTGGNSRFAGCSNLESVTFPVSLTSYGNYTFSSCSNLKNVNISNLEAWLKLGFSASYVFNNCPSHTLTLNGKIITEVAYPDGTINTGSSLAYCSSITKVTLPESVNTIGSFYGCTNLNSINIPISVTKIDSSCFRNCTNLKNIIIPSDVTSIGSYAFAYSGITELIIPEKVKTMSMRMFWGCNDLTELKFEGTPETIESLFNGQTSQLTIYCPWKKGEVAGEPWGATQATIVYEYKTN